MRAACWPRWVTVALICAIVAGCGDKSSDARPANAQEGRRVAYYRNPMDPSVTSPVPAKDHMGMDYVPVYADQQAEQGGSALQLSEATERRIGLRTVPVGFGPLPAPWRAVGIVRTNEHSVREIRLRAEGWIEELSIREVGDVLRRGQPLLKLYSPRMETAEQEFISSLGFDDANRIAISERRLRELGLEESFLATLREQRKIPHLIPFHAPFDGVVTELVAREGTYTQPSDWVMRVAALDPAWVIVELPESARRQVKVGAAVTLQPMAYPGRSFEARVDYIYPDLDATTRTWRLRVAVPNKDSELLPNMYVDAVVSGGSDEPVMHVPRDAVIRDGASDRVIVALGGGRFEPRRVQLGREAGDDIVVQSGLRQSDHVVTSAVFLIDSESSLRSGLARLDGSAQVEPAQGGPAPAHQ